MKRYRTLALVCVALVSIGVSAGCTGSDEAGTTTSAPRGPATSSPVTIDIDGLPKGRLVDREEDGLRLASDPDSDPYYERMLVVPPAGSAGIEVVNAGGQPYDPELRAGLRVAVDVAPPCAESSPVQCQIERVIVLSEDDDPEVVGALDDLTEIWPCGAAFWVSNPGQTVSIELEYVAGSGQDARVALEHYETELPSPEWRAVIVVGRDLYANWCTDLPGDEGERKVVVEWPVVAGSIEVTWAWADPPLSGPATGQLHASGLEVQAPSGARLPIDDLVVENPCWMCAAG